MRLDRPNRSFLAFMGIAVLLGALVLCGAVGGVLAPLILARISRGEWVGLSGTSLLLLFPFLALVAVGLGLGARSLARQIVASHGLARRVRALAVTVPAELTGVALQAGLEGRVVLVDASESFSFVYGILTPRVAVSRGLLEGASCGELRAVLEHECYHVCNLDPLKVVLVRALSVALFFVPALDALRARYVAGRELAADRRAVAVCGRRSLAGALLKVVRGPEWSELGVVASIGGPELLAVRVAQLETGAEPRLEAASAMRLVLSLMGVALLVVAFLASVSSFGGPTAVHHVTGTGLATATLLGSLSCTAPFAVAGLLVYAFIAMRAGRPLRFGGLWGRERSVLGS
ncbi:MAG TPA: M56 family metallopeptidase [Solirubrobacteraceae bacterium]|jgi:Zn-dependent protease with chaperone function|nr:M56 family metallopeptidase [Solirubrobacteraceae bacterium]